MSGCFFLKQGVESSVHLRTWIAGRSPQCGSWSGAHYTSSSVTVPVSTCTVRLCGDPGLELTTRAVRWLCQSPLVQWGFAGTLAWGSLHEQFGDRASPHLYSETLRGPWPVWKWFNKDHEQRGRSKPALRVVVAWLVTEADCNSSFHCEFMSTGNKSDQTGCRDKSKIIDFT